MSLLFIYIFPYFVTKYSQKFVRHYKWNVKCIHSYHMYLFPIQFRCICCVMLMSRCIWFLLSITLGIFLTTYIYLHFAYLFPHINEFSIETEMLSPLEAHTDGNEWFSNKVRDMCVLVFCLSYETEGFNPGIVTLNKLFMKIHHKGGKENLNRLF